MEDYFLSLVMRSDDLYTKPSIKCLNNMVSPTKHIIYIILWCFVVPSIVWWQVCYETKAYYEKVVVWCNSNSSSSSTSSSSSSSSTSSSSSSTSSSSSSTSSSGKWSSSTSSSSTSSSTSSAWGKGNNHKGHKSISFLPREWTRKDISPPRFILPAELTDVGVTDYFTNDQILAELWRKKWVWSLVNKTVEYQPPKWVKYTHWDNRSDLDFRRYKLPVEDHKRYMYIIIPTAGIVAPISQMPYNDDFKKVILGHKTSLRDYLYNGVLHYPHSEYAGEHGNFIVVWHSAEFKDKPWRYKTAFTTLPLVDKGDSIYVYVRQKSGIYKKFEYIATKSYNTSPKNVWVLNFKDGKNITLITCTPIWGLAGRWILEGVLIPE